MFSCGDHFVNRYTIYKQYQYCVIVSILFFTQNTKTQNQNTKTQKQKIDSIINKSNRKQQQNIKILFYFVEKHVAVYRTTTYPENRKQS